jgi:hypothetical protein
MDAERAAVRKALLVALALFLLAATPSAHIGSPDVYFQGNAGPYQLLVVVRMPRVIPGVADIEVRALSPGPTRVQVVPMRIRGLGAEFAPVPDTAERATGDPALFRAQLWIMLRGAWKVQIDADGDQGRGELAVPVAAMSTMAPPMQRPLKWLLAVLLTILMVGLVGIVGAAVREGASPPGEQPSPSASRRARLAMVSAAAIIVLVVWAGDWWWGLEATANANRVYKVPHLAATLDGTRTLSFAFETLRSRRPADRVRTDDLLPDHGHLVHLFLVRAPGLDQMFHLHPVRQEGGLFVQELPAMPSGRYELFADIVHASGFPETAVGEITLPDIPGSALVGDDSSVALSPLVEPPQTKALVAVGGDTYVRWMKDGGPLRAGEATWLRFRVEDSAGQPVADLEPYMGMAGHLAVVAADYQVFAHLHPGGSPPMATLELANGVPPMSHVHHTAMPAEIAVPYGFPREGTYRIFVQIKRAGVVETAAFDARVESGPPASRQPS